MLKSMSPEELTARIIIERNKSADNKNELQRLALARKMELRSRIEQLQEDRDLDQL